MNTLAFPATVEFGAFVLPIAGIKAASNCSSPSIERRIFLLLAISSALVTSSIPSNMELPFVEKESKAT